MKQTFTVEIDSRIALSERQIRVMITNVMKKTFEDDAMADFSCKVTQTVENERPSVVLKGLDWSNRNEDETTYHEDERALDYMVGDKE